MYNGKEYKAYPNLGAQEGKHEVKIKLALKTSSNPHGGRYETNSPIRFNGEGNSKTQAVKEVTEFLLQAKEDIETAIKEVKTI